MIDQLKKVLLTRQHQGRLYVCSGNRDTSYVYVLDGDRKILFTSTHDCIRRNTEYELDGLSEVLKDFAKKLGRRYVEAEFPDDFVLNKRVRDAVGNWDPKALNATSNRTASTSGQDDTAEGQDAIMTAAAPNVMYVQREMMQRMQRGLLDFRINAGRF